MIDLTRFLSAQERDYPIALSEIKSGYKRSHWMWYIFPQLEGFGRSSTSQYYGLKGFEEAIEYYKHPILGSRLKEISNAFLALDKCDPREILGRPDDRKLKRCMTLFDAVAKVTDDESVFAEVIAKFYDGKFDWKTMKRIEKDAAGERGVDGENGRCGFFDASNWLRDFRKASEEGFGFRELRAEIFEQTVQVIRSGFYSNGNQRIDISNNPDSIETIFYHKPDALSPSHFEIETQVRVIEADCLEVASLMQTAGMDVCILNMANRQNPGGGVKGGAGAQEENIFRRSNLFVSLYQFIDYGSEYGIRRNETFSYPLNRDTGGIYSHAVTVFRSSENTGYQFLDQPQKFDFVTVPALNRPELVRRGEHYFIADHLVAPTKEKIRTILRIVGLNKNDCLILSAFGCGAFGNPPRHMATLFKEVFAEAEFQNRFKLIVFAIIDDHNSRKEHNPDGNLRGFGEVFSYPVT